MGARTQPQCVEQLQAYRRAQQAGPAKLDYVLKSGDRGSRARTATTASRLSGGLRGGSPSKDETCTKGGPQTTRSMARSRRAASRTRLAQLYRCCVHSCAVRKANIFPRQPPAPRDSLSLFRRGLGASGSGLGGVRHAPSKKSRCMVPSFGAARISCALLYNGSASALVSVTARAPRLDRPSPRELCQSAEGGGFPQRLEGRAGGRGRDAGHGVRSSSERNHPAPRKPETALSH